MANQKIYISSKYCDRSEWYKHLTLLLSGGRSVQPILFFISNLYRNFVRLTTDSQSRLTQAYRITSTSRTFPTTETDSSSATSTTLHLTGYPSVGIAWCKCERKSSSAAVLIVCFNLRKLQNRKQASNS